LRWQNGYRAARSNAARQAAARAGEPLCGARRGRLTSILKTGAASRRDSHFALFLICVSLTQAYSVRRPRLRSLYAVAAFPLPALFRLRTFSTLLLSLPPCAPAARCPLYAALLRTRVHRTTGASLRIMRRPVWYGVAFCIYCYASLSIDVAVYMKEDGRRRR